MYTGILFHLEQLFVDEYLIILSHDLALQDLPVFDEAFEFLYDEDGLSRDAEVREQDDNGVEIPQQLKQYGLNWGVVSVSRNEGTRSVNPCLL